MSMPVPSLGHLQFERLAGVREGEAQWDPAGMEMSPDGEDWKQLFEARYHFRR